MDRLSLSKLFLAAATFVAFGISACGGADVDVRDPSAKSTRSAGDGASMASPSGDQASLARADDFSAYAGWTRINDATFISKGHKDTWVDVYVEPQFAEAYRAMNGTMPVGMRVAKVAYHDNDGAPGEVKGVTAMRKQSPGYDSEHGDWWYGVYDAAASTPMKSGKIEACTDCHDLADDTDYLGGVPGL